MDFYTLYGEFILVCQRFRWMHHSVTLKDGGSTFLQNIKMNSLCYVV